MVPVDRVILRKVRAYDPNLSIEWNNKHEYFELFMKRPFWRGGGRVLITPVTQSIYDTRLPKKFVQLDERLLWWIYEADSQRNGGAKKHALQIDSRWVEWQKKVDRRRFDDAKNRAKDFWQTANQFSMTKGTLKNGKPKFNNFSSTTKWVKPDGKKITSDRIFNRSKGNALRYNYK